MNARVVSINGNRFLQFSITEIAKKVKRVYVMAITVDQEDYYFGVALLIFFTENKGAKPALIESLDHDTRCYQILTDDNEHICLYMKHSENPKESLKDKSLSWTFSFTDKDKQRIQEYVKSAEGTYIILLCSEKPFTNTQFAVIKQEEFLLLAHKKSITVKWEMANKQRRQSFTIPNQSGKPISIRCDRITKKITEI